jgi:hypothetical protein
VFITLAFLPGARNPQNEQFAGMLIMFVAYAAAFAVQAITKPVYGIALVLFYYDQRIRIEAFDIEWMMQRAGLVVPEAAGRLEAEGGGGFNPRIEPKESPWASAPKAGSSPSPSQTNPPQPGELV